MKKSFRVLVLVLMSMSGGCAAPQPADHEIQAWERRAAGVTIVTDTCTYITSILTDTVGPAMTDSAKWAYYAPGTLGVGVVFGSTGDCVESAVAGRVVLNEEIWS